MEEIDDYVLSDIKKTHIYVDSLHKINLRELDKKIKDQKILLLIGSGFSNAFGIKTFEQMKKEDCYYDIFSFDNFEYDTIHFLNHMENFRDQCKIIPKISIPSNCFVVTTNIDGILEGDNIYEIHGNIFQNQCTLCKKIVRCTEVIQSCETCGIIMRPYIQMYGDGDFINNIPQMKKYMQWKQQNNDFCVIEIGCGTIVPILRHESSCLANKNYNVFRLNNKDFDKKIIRIDCTVLEFCQYFFHK